MPTYANKDRKVVRFFRETQKVSEGYITLGFSQEDQARMTDLAQRNQDGALSDEEHEELMHFVGAGHLLALLHAKARKALQQKQAS